MKQKIVDFLLDNADPSIVLRVKKEVMNSLSKNEEEELLEKILKQKIVQTIISAQKPDGWIGNTFHGQSKKLGAGMYDNMEVGLRYLAEKGVPPESEYIRKAIGSFLNREPFDDIYMVKPPKPPATDYTYTAYGLYLMRSSVIIRAGYEYRMPKNDIIDLKYDIDYSLKTFANVLNYKNADDVVYRRRNKLCFKEGVLWPCIYNLRILAHSQGWRNESNIALLAESVERLFSFPQSGEGVYTYINGQLISPCMPFIHRPILDPANNKTLITMWFEIMELFARCGIVKKVTSLKKEYKNMLSLINDNLNMNIKPDRCSSHYWSPYFGIALEEDWKSKNRLKSDLLFRILLIIHYTEKSEQN